MNLVEVYKPGIYCLTLTQINTILILFDNELPVPYYEQFDFFSDSEMAVYSESIISFKTPARIVHTCTCSGRI